MSNPFDIISLSLFFCDVKRLSVMIIILLYSFKKNFIHVSVYVFDSAESSLLHMGFSLQWLLVAEHGF